MQKREASPACSRDDLVAEHGAGRRSAELLDVGAAEPAGEHLERVLRLGQIGELRPAVSI
jgi:hypothetical protein